MVDTARTISYLKVTNFPSGHVAVSQDARDLIETLLARTGAGKINLVTAPEYGADPTGTSDSTAAFAAALAGPAVAIVPPGLYKISNLVMPSGSSLVGYSALTYGKPSSFAWFATAMLIPVNGSTVRILNVDAAANVYVANLIIECDSTRSDVMNTTCDGISAGGQDLRLETVSVRSARYGLGGAVATGSNVSNTAIAVVTNCQFYGCQTGIGDISDAFIVNTQISFCTVGCGFTGNTGSVALGNCRIEWCTQYGIQTGAISNIQISNCLFDHNNIAGLYMSGTYKGVFTGNDFRRNGRNLDSHSCHVRLNACANLTFTGNQSRAMNEDNGTGSNSPAVWVREDGTSSAIVFVGNDLSGVTATTPMVMTDFWVGNLPTSYTFAKNYGLLMDSRIGSRPVNYSGFTFQDRAVISVVASGTVAVQFVHEPVPNWTCEYHELRLSMRNETSGAFWGGTFKYMIQRSGAGASITQAAVTGEIGTAGHTAFGSGAVQLSWTSIATDASTYSLTVNNTGTGVEDITVMLV